MFPATRKSSSGLNT